jgi:hypothetical protein
MLKVFVFQIAFLEVFVYMKHKEHFLVGTNDPQLTDGELQQKIM